MLAGGWLELNEKHPVVRSVDAGCPDSVSPWIERDVELVVEFDL